MKWEYTIVGEQITEEDEDAASDDVSPHNYVFERFNNRCNELSDEGWELLNVTTHFDSPEEFLILGFFKRLVPSGDIVNAYNKRVGR